MAEEVARDEAGRFKGASIPYSRELADEICELMASGMTLRMVCREEGMPNFSTVSCWAARDVDGFYERYMMARRIQASIWFDEIIDIADDSSGDWVEITLKDGRQKLVPAKAHMERARQRIESRKWCCAKAHPEAYGDKTQIQHSGKIGGGQPVVVAGMSAQEAASAYAALVKGDE